MQSKLQLKSRAFPVDILEHWMKTAHSRLRNEDRIERLIALRNAVLHPEDAKLRRKVDDSLLERLEELLISSDLGVETAVKISASFSDAHYGKKLNLAEVKQHLANEVNEILARAKIRQREKS